MNRALSVLFAIEFKSAWSLTADGALASETTDLQSVPAALR